MGVVNFPVGSGVQDYECAICGRVQKSSALSAGLVDEAGDQAFACDSHFKYMPELIRGWAEFMVRQSEISNDPMVEYGVAPHLGRRVPPEGHYMERRSLHTGLQSSDIAKHLFTRQLPGTILILVDNRSIRLSAIRKQWLKVLRVVRLEQASTLKSSRVRELNHMMTRMQHWRWTKLCPENAPDSDVFVIDQDDLAALPPKIHTLYVACKLEEDDFARLVARMPSGSLVVYY